MRSDRSDLRLFSFISLK